MTDKRLIEVAFPLRQTSIDSVHEKNVRHGHISTLHIWPARRPLAACRAALIATLLPDPGDKEQRDALLKRLGGTLNKTTKKKKMPNGRVEEIEALETEGGILHWGRESGPDLDWFRQEIRKAYGGRAPKVLDPFAGGGAIPLEAMRLGCEVTAADINPVAWFILKCTLEYPQKLAGQKRRLPDFALADADFMAAYFKAQGLTPAQIKRHLRTLAPSPQPLPPLGGGAFLAPLSPAGRGAGGEGAKGAGLEHIDRRENLDWIPHPGLEDAVLEADLAWHVRAWGRWVLRRARLELARFYPTYAEYCTVKPYQRVKLDHGEPLRLVPLNDAGEPQTALLNAGFDAAYLDNPTQPRWIAKPTVAYLWARTVKCKACRATLPLLKTRWLAKKDDKRIVLTMKPRADKSGVEFGIDYHAKVEGANAAQRREHDKRLGAGTMSRAGAMCPCCGTIMTPEDLRLEAQSGRLGHQMTAVICEGGGGKEYRLPTPHELTTALSLEESLIAVGSLIPDGFPQEAVPQGGSRVGGGSPFTVHLYNMTRWGDLFSDRQRLAMGYFLLSSRNALDELGSAGYGLEWVEAISAYLGITLDKLADYIATLCTWHVTGEKMSHVFVRFALPMNWDYAELNPLSDSSGNYLGCLDWVARIVENTIHLAKGMPAPIVKKMSATEFVEANSLDIIVTDPPYYDAIPYSDLMDFFYVWLRRTLNGLSPEIDAAFAEPLAPKWNHDANDGELIDDASRFDGDKEASKRNYEEGMARAFRACHTALRPDGRLVIVFAHKHPDAWETLVGAIIKAGFVVDGSWPIQTEMGNRTRAISSAALSSSVWLVCRKRDPAAKAGWDAQVLKDMKAGIVTQLRDFWDAGIRGPDFVWAATGPAMEAYSRYPAVKKASAPGQLMLVTEFLSQVRRMVVDFVVGRVLSHGQADAPTGGQPLDDITTYYLLHRNDFGLKDAPAGPCILYAVSCGLSERELADQYELLAKSGGAAAADEETDDDDEDAGTSASGGGQFKLKAWNARKNRSLGLETTSGRTVPLIDQIHKLMQLWGAGDVIKVNDYLDNRGLRRSHLFAQLIQALIEKSRAEGSAEECSLLERLSNYLKSVGSTAQDSLPLG